MKDTFSEISRHLKLYGIFFKMSFMSIMEYRANFIIGILVELCYISSKVLYLVVVYNTGVTINGFTPDYITLYVGSFSIISAIYNGFFMDNIYNIPYQIKTGSLDMLITKPVSLQFMLTVRVVNFSMMLANFICGLVMVIMGWSRLGIAVNFINVLGYIVFIINGIIMAYIVFLIPMLLSFWTIETRALIEISDKVWSFNSMPMTIYNKIIQRIGMFIIPIFAVTNLPSLFLVRRLQLSYVIWMVAGPIIFFIIMRLIWNIAIKKYESANL